MTGRVLSRRSALAGLTAGAAAVAGGICAEDLLGGSGPRPVAAMLDDLVGSYDFNQGWLFGGPYVKGAESPGHDDSGYARVTLPHTVTDLSWACWDYRTWERTWIYRKHFDSAFAAGSRVLVTFERGHDERHRRAQRPGGGHARRRLPALDGRAHRPAQATRQRARRHRGRPLARRPAGRPARRAADHGLPAAGLHLPGRTARGGSRHLPGGRLRPSAERARSRPHCPGHGERPGGHRPQGRGRGRHRRPARRRPHAGHRPDDAAHRPAGHARRRAHHRRDWPGELLVAGAAEAVHGPHDPDLRRGLRCASPAGRHAHDRHQDRLSRGRLPPGRLLPQRQPAGDLRPQPAPAVPLPRHGGPGPAPAQGRGDPQERAQRQHGPLLALPAVAALPGRL